jgi:site-specific DNA-methyltransferase (adenine-specific)
MEELGIDNIYCGRSEELLERLAADSIACSVWSPPYHVGKEYEKNQSYEEWQEMLRKVIAGHVRPLKPGGFMVINIADILCFPDEAMPRIQLPNISKHKCAITREQVLKAKAAHPDFDRYKIAAMLGCSEQTIDRRLNGNNIRGGKYQTQTRVQLVGTFLQEAAHAVGLFLYDRRVWCKDPAWANCQWHSSSYRSVDEFEYLYFFWKPGETPIKRDRIERHEWADWGSRGVWQFRSVRANDIHEAMFPPELPKRCIRLLTDPGDTVLDPFMGSGTTAVAAVELGRHYIGFDKSDKFVRLAKARVARTQAEPALF